METDPHGGPLAAALVEVRPTDFFAFLKPVAMAPPKADQTLNLNGRFHKDGLSQVGLSGMWKWIKWAALTAVVSYLGYSGYAYYRGGFHTRPPMPEGAFALSYKSGLRGIVIGVSDERATRKYLGMPMEVPFYLQDTWSFCHPPNDNELAYFPKLVDLPKWPGMRLDAVCKIDVDGKDVMRGVIVTVPKL